MGKNKFQPTEPYYSKKTSYFPAPRGAKRGAVLLLSVIGIIFVALIAAIVAGAMGDLWNRELSDEEALKLIEDYREGSMVDLDAYLTQRRYEAMGAPGEYVYRSKDKTISIQDYGDYVRVGDGEGNSNQYGIGYDTGFYVCRVCYLNEATQEEEYCDLNLSSEALAAIIRLRIR